MNGVERTEKRPRLQVAANEAVGQLCELAEEQQSQDRFELADRLWEIGHGLEIGLRPQPPEVYPAPKDTP